MAEFCTLAAGRADRLGDTRLNCVDQRPRRGGHAAAGLCDRSGDARRGDGHDRPGASRPDAKLLWIRDTLHLAEVECGEAYLAEARSRPDLEILDRAAAVAVSSGRQSAERRNHVAGRRQISAQRHPLAECRTRSNRRTSANPRSSLPHARASAGRRPNVPKNCPGRKPAAALSARAHGIAVVGIHRPNAGGPVGRVIGSLTDNRGLRSCPGLRSRRRRRQGRLLDGGRLVVATVCRQIPASALVAPSETSVSNNPDNAMDLMLGFTSLD